MRLLRPAAGSRSEWIAPFTGLTPAQFRKLVRLVAQRGGDEIVDGRPGRPWALPLPDWVLLVAVYWRTNLTMRQIDPLFGVSHAAAHRVIDRYSTHVQIAIDADTRLVIAIGDPQPGNRHDCTVHRDSGIEDQIDDHPVMTDGGYRSNAVSGIAHLHDITLVG